MNCKYYRTRTKKKIKYGYCVKYKKEVFLFCKECNKIEYKPYKSLKPRANKQTKKEKGRFSIIYPDLTKCCECGLKNGDYDNRIKRYTLIAKNEVFEGAYRQISMTTGMIAPFCTFCHDKFHNDTSFNLKYKVMFQKEYMKSHSLDNFILTYGQNYIYKLEQIKKVTINK